MSDFPYLAKNLLYYKLTSQNVLFPLLSVVPNSLLLSFLRIVSFLSQSLKKRRIYISIMWMLLTFKFFRVLEICTKTNLSYIKYISDYAKLYWLTAYYTCYIPPFPFFWPWTQFQDGTGLVSPKSGPAQ